MMTELPFLKMMKRMIHSNLTLVPTNTPQTSINNLNRTSLLNWKLTVPILSLQNKMKK